MEAKRSRVAPAQVSIACLTLGVCTCACVRVFMCVCVRVCDREKEAFN